MTTTVAFDKSWNSSLTAWNTDTWNGGGTFPSATGSVGSSTITGFANVSVTGEALALLQLLELPILQLLVFQALLL